MESRLAAIRTDQKPKSRFDPLALRRWFKRAVEGGESRRSILTKLVREIRFGNGEIEIDFVFPAIILPEKGGVSGPPSPLNRFDHVHEAGSDLV